MKELADRWLIIPVTGSAGISLASVPELPYVQFAADLRRMLTGPERENRHCSAYFAVPATDVQGGLVFYAMVVSDRDAGVWIASHRMAYYDEGVLESLSGDIPALNVFEREISERFGVRFQNSPWAKPLRYPYNRYQQDDTTDNYPFYTIDNPDIHQVHVGPVHAVIIEPGSFRFLCSGERILHLEIALGYQHRGIESLIAGTNHRLRQITLGESIAGDTAIGHAVAMAQILESGTPAESGREIIACERAVALEMERLAIHIGDTAALCMDIAYQTGQVACEALRTLVINAMQQWCGNRFGKGLIRPGGSNFRLNLERIKHIESTLQEVIRRYRTVQRDLLSTPSVLSRLEGICSVSREQALRVGAVGMAARMAGIRRDIRMQHNFYPLCDDFQPAHEEGGDLLARLKIRFTEANQSYAMIMAGCKRLSGKWFEAVYPQPKLSGVELPGGSLLVSLVEGWRGEICHVALTDENGEIATYKVIDPSVHNWIMLALSVRGQQISDFPVSNKSFNLSYCGHDL